MKNDNNNDNDNMFKPKKKLTVHIKNNERFDEVSI